MMVERKNLEFRILKILKFINHPIIETLEKNLGLFSIRELLQISEYLETWSLNPIHQFLEDKQKEYKDIINNIKIIKNYSNLWEIKLKERLETEKEQKEIELIDFDY